jgi:Winged helix-turn helix
MMYQRSRARRACALACCSASAGAGNSFSTCRAFDVCRNTVLNVRERFAKGGVDGVLRHKRQARYRQALTGAQQAHFIAIACSKVPAGGRAQRATSHYRLAVHRP